MQPGSGLPPRRAVVVADAGTQVEVTIRPDLDDAVVRLSGPLPIDAVVAVYVDNADAESAVLAAVDVIDEADMGTRTPNSRWETPRITTWRGTPCRNCRSCWNCSDRQTGIFRCADSGCWGRPPVPAGAAVTTTDFRNVKIFDGHSDRLSAPSNVRVKGNRIELISTDALPADPAATVIDGGGRTLMPGLIDNHWHTMLVRPPVTQLTTLDPGYLNLLAAPRPTTR